MKTLALLLTITTFLCATPAIAEELTVPPAVSETTPATPEIPDLSNPDPMKLSDPDYLRENFTCLLVNNFRDDPNLPIIFCAADVTGEAIVIVLDSDNGTDEFSIRTDPIVLITVHSISRTFVDSGFKNGGRANKQFEELKNFNEIAPRKQTSSVTHI